MQQEKKGDTSRTTNKFAEPAKFYDRLYDRLYTVLRRYVLTGGNNAEFTFFLTAVPRYAEQSIDLNKPEGYDPKIGYQGTQRQQELLRGTLKRTRNVYQGTDLSADEIDALLEQSWASLGASEMELHKMFISKKLHEILIEAEEGISISKIVREAQGTLKTYFESVSQRPEDYYRHERKILSAYGFDLENDLFFSIPLFQFGDFDGIIHIIYQAKAASVFQYTENDPHKNARVDENIKRLIDEFRIEYEGVILAWHLPYDDSDYDHALRKAIDDVVTDDFWERNRYRFLGKVLDWKRSYEDHYPYYRSRLKQHDNIRKEVYLRVLNQAVITVLLDSYAHNVGAHTLSTLAGIFSERATLRADRWKYEAEKEGGKESLKEPRSYRGPFGELVNIGTSDLIHEKGKLSLETAAFFRFLQEKSGFWSGLTRDYNPGGLVSDLYGALMGDFMLNTLYLGTVAESEEIYKINLKVSFLASETGTDTAFRATADYAVEATGCLAYVDIRQRDAEHLWDRQAGFYVKHPKAEGGKLLYNDHAELDQLSRFVCPGDEFVELKKRLKAVKVFWPGGIVGKHAFFNIIENELRNIKHAKTEALNKAKEHGLDLHISVQRSNAGGNDLFRIGIWLGIEVELGGEETAPLVKRRFDTLWEDIIDIERNPKLSGSTQDKVCAAMLFNNSFSSVQNVTWILSHMDFLSGTTEKRDRRFYPWITPAVSLADGGGEFQMRPPGSEKGFLNKKKPENEQKKDLDKAFQDRYSQFATPQSTGFLKKYLYLWEGQNVRQAGSPVSETENIGRFKVVLVDDAESLTKARRAGVVRALAAPALRPLPDDSDEHKNAYLLDCYKAWLRVWLGAEPTTFFWSDDNGNACGAMSFDPNSSGLLRFWSDRPVPPELEGKAASEYVDQGQLEDLKKSLPNRTDLQFAHSDEKAAGNAIRYRRHGVMNRYFLPLVGSASSMRLRLADLSKLLFPEFVEMIATRICVVDSRVQGRMEQSNRAQGFYLNQLNTLFCAERAPLKPNENWSLRWGRGESPDADSFVRNCHFLVLHLSFIERILQEQYAGKTRSDDVDFFVKNVLLSVVGDGQKLRENFVLVVTSGRGRSDWWKNLYPSKSKDGEEPSRPASEFAGQIIFRPIESILAAIEGHNTQKDDFELKYRLTKVLFGS